MAESYGGVLTEADEKWAQRLRDNGAAGATYGPYATVLPDGTRSDLLEECRHIWQNMTGMNDDLDDANLRTILNEIEAREYLIRVEGRYSIPKGERELTRRQLAKFRRELEDYKREHPEWQM